MVILAKNQWIKKIKKQKSDKQSKLLNVEMLECGNSHIHNDTREIIFGKS